MTILGISVDPAVLTRCQVAPLLVDFEILPEPEPASRILELSGRTASAQRFVPIAPMRVQLAPRFEDLYNDPSPKFPAYIVSGWFGSYVTLSPSIPKLPITMLQLPPALVDLQSPLKKSVTKMTSVSFG